MQKSLAPKSKQPVLYLDPNGYPVSEVDQGQGVNWEAKQAEVTTAVLVDEEDVLPPPVEEEEQVSYDVKARESRYSRFSEEFAYQNSRKKQLSQMDKKQRHLLLFTNFEQLNFTNINKSELVKAWALLYHFKSASSDSNLHAEFYSIVQRNSVNKATGHELFAKFHKELLA